MNRLLLTRMTKMLSGRSSSVLKESHQLKILGTLDRPYSNQLNKSGCSDDHYEKSHGQHSHTFQSKLGALTILAAAAVGVFFTFLCKFRSSNLKALCEVDKKNSAVPSWLAQQMRVTAAYHEAGHAVCAWYLPHVKEVCEVSIKGDERRGGYTQFTKNKNNKTEEELFDQICVDLAGMAAEELFLGGITPLSNSDDMASVLHLAAIAYSRLYVQLGLASRKYNDDEKKHVEQTLSITVICKAYSRTMNLLREHQEDVRKVANLLLDRDVLSTADMTQLLGKRPTVWRPRFQ